MLARSPSVFHPLRDTCPLSPTAAPRSRSSPSRHRHSQVPFLLLCRISFASFNMTPAGATTRSSRFVIIWWEGEDQVIQTPAHGSENTKPLCPRETLHRQRSPQPSNTPPDTHGNSLQCSVPVRAVARWDLSRSAPKPIGAVKPGDGRGPQQAEGEHPQALR